MADRRFIDPGAEIITFPCRRSHGTAEREGGHCSTAPEPSSPTGPPRRTTGRKVHLRDSSPNTTSTTRAGPARGGRPRRRHRSRLRRRPARPGRWPSASAAWTGADEQGAGRGTFVYEALYAWCARPTTAPAAEGTHDRTVTPAYNRQKTGRWPADEDPGTRTPARLPSLVRAVLPRPGHLGWANWDRRPIATVGYNATRLVRTGGYWMTRADFVDGVALGQTMTRPARRPGRHVGRLLAPRPVGERRAPRVSSCPASAGPTVAAIYTRYSGLPIVQCAVLRHSTPSWSHHRHGRLETSPHHQQKRRRLWESQ